MASLDPETTKILQIARSYYLGEKKQSEIAAEENMTQSQVSNYLKLARERGYITTDIKRPATIHMEEKFKKWYPHLKEVIIVDYPDDIELTNNLGKAGARYFERIVKNEKTIALSCGSTIGAMINNLSPNKYDSLEVFSLLIEGTKKIIGWTPVSLVGTLIEKYQSSDVIGYGYQLPPFPTNVEKAKRKKREYENDQNIRELLEKAENADYIFLGIGALNKKRRGFEFDQFIEERKIKEKITKSTEKFTAIGEIAYQPFDYQGKQLIDLPGFESLKYGILYVHLNKLKKRVANGGTVVAIAGGTAKHDAILASLSTKCYNVLICDIHVAGAIVNVDY